MLNISRRETARAAAMATFVALRCYACGMFQVKQLKGSSDKWSCCICNEKQSVCKVYGQSSAAKDIRKIVQALNLSKREEQSSLASEIKDEVIVEDELGPVGVHCGESKWKVFLDDEDITHAECSTDGDEGAENYVTVLPEIRQRKRKSLSGSGVRSSKAPSRASVETSSISLKQLGMPAFSKSNRGKDLKLEPAAQKEKSPPDCKNRRFMKLTTDHPTNRDDTRSNNVAVRAGDKDKYVVKSSSKWNEYLEDEQKQLHSNDLSSRKVSVAYKNWSTFQQELSLDVTQMIATELEDEVVVADDDVS